MPFSVTEVVMFWVFRIFQDRTQKASLNDQLVLKAPGLNPFVTKFAIGRRQQTRQENGVPTVLLLLLLLQINLAKEC